MLLVFLMASMIAIGLYMEIPRVAMETQRAKEQLLIDRGEQYKRAIQLFVKKANRYPGDIKDLENFQNQRFLRHRYRDPMTGKEEWRLIHIQNGILTDSLVTKPQQGKQQEESHGPGLVTEIPGLGTQTNQGPGGAANVRDRRRTTEGGVVNGPPNEVPPGGIAGIPPQPGMPPLPGQTNPTGQPGFGQPIPGQPPLPGGMPGGIPGGIPGVPTTTPTTPTTPSSGGGLVGSSGRLVGGGSLVGPTPGLGSTPGSTYPGQTLPGQLQPGQPIPGQLPGQPGMPVNSQTGGISPYNTLGGANGNPPGFPQPGQGPPGAPNNAAADLIRNILTTPRPGGMPQQTMGGQTIGGGIAGVATTLEGESVKIYNDRSLYQEWEFIFDPAKVKQIPDPRQNNIGTPAEKLGTRPGESPTNNPRNPTPFPSPGFNPTMPRPGGQ
jgi:hypothetical protein